MRDYHNAELVNLAPGLYPEHRSASLVRGPIKFARGKFNRRLDTNFNCVINYMKFAKNILKVIMEVIMIS